MPAEHWYVFIVRCTDGSLYTGVNGDIERTVIELNAGRGSAYTKSRLPVFLAYTEEYMNESDALKRANLIKRLSRSAKEDLLSIPNIGSIGEPAYGI